MKRLISVLILTLVCGAFIAASAQENGEKQYKIRHGKQKTVTSDKVKIKFLSVVEDSRCPENVNCIHAGNARIKVEVSRDGYREILEMNTNIGPKGARFAQYGIYLTSLTPAPKADKKISKKSYTATFEISRSSR